MSKRPHARAPRRPSTAAAVVATPPLYGFGLRLFGAFAVAMLVAFWPSYFGRLDSQPSYHPHAHGLTMTAWVVLLLVQAWLVFSGDRPLHRRVGRLGFIAVPALVGAAVHFLHFRVRGAVDLGPTGLYFVTLVVNALVAFLALFGLAMYYRRTPPVHARFMIATVFPLFTPVTDRLIGPYLPGLVPLVPRIGGSPVLPAAGFLLADAILIGLSIWDYLTTKRMVFPVALGVLLLYHWSVLTWYRFGWWQAVGAWFVSLPLS